VRANLNAFRPYAFFSEQERAREGPIVPVSTIFLTNRECPWHCVMCDLWKNTLTESVPVGAIPAQIEYALERLPRARHVKLYNSGSFFDRRAIPAEDYRAIAALLTPFEHVIVESHPALVGDDCLRFRDLLAGRLEVAMGLETAEPTVLARLNKHMTLEQFEQAADFLRFNGIDLRAFILVKPPFMRADDAVYWAERSLDFAFECGASAASLIPTRGGDRAAQPSIAMLEAAVDYGVALAQGRVFADLWDLRRFSQCDECYQVREARLARINLAQTLEVRVDCGACR
jgi:hypothetical protein